jgi:hypothetical protein
MPTDTDPSVRPPRRRLPLRYFIAALISVLALPVVIWVVWGWIEATRLDRALDALEARHEPLDVAELELKPTTPEQRQASHFYGQAGKLVDTRAIATHEAAQLATAIETACSRGFDSEHNAQIRALVQFEQSFPPVFALLERASDLDARGWDDGDRPRRYSMEEMRPITLARANVVHIARLACSGEGDAAARALLASLRLRRVWVSAMIAPIALQTSHSLSSILMLTTPSASLLHALEAEYLAAADETAFAAWMQRERAVWLSMALPGMFSDLPGSAPRMTPLQAMALRVVRPLRDHRIVDELNEFDAAMEIATEPWPRKLDAIAEFGETRRSRNSQSMPRGLLETLTRPVGAHAASNALMGYIGGMTETLARNRASAAAIAVTLYRGDKHGEFPHTLSELVPAYLPAAPVDPYSGASLTYRHDGNGFKVYSIGANRQDDGGVWEQHSDLQLSRRGNPLDIGIAVNVPTVKAN